VIDHHSTLESTSTKLQYHIINTGDLTPSSSPSVTNTHHLSTIWVITHPALDQYRIAVEQMGVTMDVGEKQPGGGQC
jgi:hypothetical protein